MENNELSTQISSAGIAFQVDTSKSVSEQAKDAVNFLATKQAVADENLVDEITQAKKQELKEGAQAQLKKERAENKKAEVVEQEAEYGVFNGVATYAGVKKPLPKKLQKLLFCILAFFQIPFLIIIGIPTSIINILADCIDTIMGKLSSIAKSARILVISLLVLAVIGGLIFLGVHLLKKYNVI